MSGRRSVSLDLLAILIVALGLRTWWLTADPPSDPTVGIVWHDEGAWVHSARNKALWGAWRADAWNPVFLAPVFTAAEYASFASFGVGTWQARVVPVGSGLIAIAAIAWGLGAVAGRRAALVGALLLSTNFFFVMWNRAALMESTMTAAIAMGWAAYAVANARRPVFGLIAGTAAVAAFFTKAAAAFFVAALVLDVLETFVAMHLPAIRTRLGMPPPTPTEIAAARWTIAGLTIAGAVALAIFVIPFWTEFRFYNWEMSVTRKPAYTVRAFLDRASWLPIVHDVLTRMWPVVVVALAGATAIVSRWRRVTPGARLLVLWLGVGMAEMVVHDTGNERRYVMLVPALVALAAWAIARSLPRTEDEAPRPAPLWLIVPVLLACGYIAAGSLVRLFDVRRIYGGDLSWAVWSAALAAVAATIGLVAVRARLTRWLALPPWPTRALVVFMAAAGVIDAAQYVHWARTRTYLNYNASIAVGALVPAGTPVHGKLANGLSLENRIRPVFVGRGFGNYADRLTRADVRFLLTYVAPTTGYEGPVILDVLDAVPGYRVLATFPVQETPATDTAALIDKYPERGPAPIAVGR